MGAAVSHPPLIAIARPQLLHGVPGTLYAGTHLVPKTRRLLPDYRHGAALTGRIVDYMMLRPSASAPEVPYVKGRVWLLRAIDGLKVWEGFTDQDGRYSAEGLELGVAYIPVGIDPTGQHKAAAAGPAVATLTGERPAP